MYFSNSDNEFSFGGSKDSASKDMDVGADLFIKTQNSEET